MWGLTFSIQFSWMSYSTRFLIYDIIIGIFILITPLILIFWKSFNRFLDKKLYLNLKFTIKS